MLELKAEAFYSNVFLERRIELHHLIYHKIQFQILNSFFQKITAGTNYKNMSAKISTTVQSMSQCNTPVYALRQKPFFADTLSLYGPLAAQIFL